MQQRLTIIITTMLLIGTGASRSIHRTRMKAPSKYIGVPIIDSHNRSAFSGDGSQSFFWKVADELPDTLLQGEGKNRRDRTPEITGELEAKTRPLRDRAENVVQPRVAHTGRQHPVCDRNIDLGGSGRLLRGRRDDAKRRRNEQQASQPKQR